MSGLEEMMNDPDFAAFLALHSGMPRQGPGEISDVGWAARVAGVGRAARIADLGCGPGDDFLALSALAPEGQVIGIDAMEGLAAEAAQRAAGLPNVTARHGDMMAPEGGPFDFIWSAGAVYHVGITEALTAWRPHLAEGGAVAFSELHWRVPADARPAEAAAFWAEGYPAMTDAAGIAARIAAAGYRLLDSLVLSDSAWEAYYAPLEARIAAEEARADAHMQQAIAADRQEIALWRAHRDTFGYLLCVVAPA